MKSDTYKGHNKLMSEVSDFDNIEDPRFLLMPKTTFNRLNMKKNFHKRNHS